ncbi:putative disease resistance protein At5g05400 [Prosopis cineraria]|uniref:putative disease resistance protein At5g05400 n=1 Tax=Prosopis cineraria TaxID=364024 RepID=UPI00240EDA91|nr:putative disease resistance protein At5g05400 [Prosopis cineraria]
MEKAGAGGRPKAVDMWEHVTQVLIASKPILIRSRVREFDCVLVLLSLTIPIPTKSPVISTRKRTSFLSLMTFFRKKTSFIHKNKALQSDVSSFLKFVERHNMRENYMFDLKYCEKIFIPVHVEKNRCGHFYLYIIHVEDQVVEIWDSLRDQFMDKTEREQITKKILLVMETLFEDVMSTKFHWRMASNIQSQSNGYDCGVFVIKYMQQLDNYVRQNPSFQFDSNKERLDLALELLNSDFNQEREILSHKATGSYAQVHSEEDIDSCGIKRKQVDTCKTIFGGGKGAYVELDDFNDRVKRKNVSSKTGCVYVLPTTELVGRCFKWYSQRIWKWIMGDEVSTIGIWGMGGAGKTFLATHVHNKLLEEAGDDFDQVIWVTASQYGSIYELQKAIARSINLDISDECDVKRISGKLLQASNHINRCVLILDNIRDPILLGEEVGFPVSNDRIKLILTTRSWEVCQSMNCMENIIEVKPLDDEFGEDWELFEKTLGIHQMQSSGVESIARTLVEQCGGLPLAIVTIARSMKGKKTI